MVNVSSEITNKVVLGEVTLGEVWEFVKDKVDHVLIAESEFKWGPYVHISLVPGVGLKVSSLAPDLPGFDAFEPEYSFDLNTKVQVKDDHLEFAYEGEQVQLYFMYQPEPQSIQMGFLFSGD